MIFEEVKKSFKTVNANPAITLFFVSFLILVSLFIPYMFAFQNRIYGLIILLCIFFLTVLFFGGWFQIFNQVQKEDKKSLVGAFFEGAGKNIISSAITIIIYILLFVLMSFIAYIVSMKFIGDSSILLNELATVAQEKSAYLDYINSLSNDKMIILYGWQLTFVLFYSAFHFLLMFLPAVFIKSEVKNAFLKPFIVYFENFKFVFKNFGFSIRLFLLICLGFILTGILKIIASFHIILSIAYLFIYIYFLSYVVMLIFNCYERKNTCTDGDNGVGENQDGDSTGKEE